MKSGDGFVLVFSVTSMESLNELSSLRDQILRLKEVDGLHEVSHQGSVYILMLYIPSALTTLRTLCDCRTTSRLSWWETRVRSTFLSLHKLIHLQTDFALHLFTLPAVDLYEERRVPREIPVALTAQTWRGVPYYETSARKNLNVANVFEDVVRQIIRQKSNAEQEKRDRKAQRKSKMKCVII